MVRRSRLVVVNRIHLIEIIINMIFVYAVLKNTLRLEKLLGKTGLNILRKAFGIILLAIAIKLFRHNTGL